MASCSPVEAPEGTAARPTIPPSRRTSASTVGLPRESRISRPWTAMIFVDIIPPEKERKQDARLKTGATKATAGSFRFLDHGFGADHDDDAIFGNGIAGAVGFEIVARSE